MNFTDPLDPCAARPEQRESAVLLSCIAAFFLVTGIAFQKRSLSAPRPWFTWLFGLAFILGGLATYYAAMVFAPEVFVAPLLALINIFNFILGRCLNKEEIDLDMGMYTTAITFGCLLAAVAAAVCTPNATLNIVRLGVYSGMHFLFMILSAYLVMRAHWIAKHEGIAVTAYKKRAPLFRIAYPLLAALLISYAMLMGRTMALYPDKLWLIAIVIIFSSLALFVMNLAIAAFDTVVVVPLAVAFTVMSSIIAGGVVFSEFQYFTPIQLILFISGCMLAFPGIIAGVHKPPVYKEVENGQDEEMSGFNVQ